MAMKKKQAEALASELTSLASVNDLSSEAVVTSFSHGMDKAYRQALNDHDNVADIEVIVDLTNLEFSITYSRVIVEEASNDLVEVSLDSVLKQNRKKSVSYHIGDHYVVEGDFVALSEPVLKNMRFIFALDAISRENGIPQEDALSSLSEAIQKAYRKSIGGEGNEKLGLAPADVRVTIDPDNAVINMVYVRKIVEEDDITDDLLEISIDEVKELAKSHNDKTKYKVGDEYMEYADVLEFAVPIVKNIKSIFHQKQTESEKQALLTKFENKISTMITGRVVKVEDSGVSIDIGTTSVFLPRKQMIGDERFSMGDPIRIFVDKVEVSAKGGPKIIVSRSSEGFLRALFMEENRDIYDGTIEIKALARRAGERSKVAVYSNDPNVDPAGACIGPNGSKIQRIVGQLGNGGTKEKIDVITYSNNPAMFIMEALKPAHALCINIKEDEKKATVIVSDADLSQAIGRKGVNVVLASRLTGYSIDVKPESEKPELEYITYEEADAKEMITRAERLREVQLEAMAQYMSSIPGVPENYVAPQEREYSEEVDEEMSEALARQIEKEEESAVSEAPAAPVESIIEEAPVAEEAPVVEEAPVTTTVKTTTTLEDLEKALAQDESKAKAKSTKKTSSKKKEEKSSDEDEAKPVIDESNIQKMSIYTEEELAAFEEEEREAEDYDDSDEDIDYDEYDEFYDEN